MTAFFQTQWGLGAAGVLRRSRNGVWQLEGPDGRLDGGRLLHVWRGPWWLSLRVAGPGAGRARVLTLWRHRLAPGAWHGLCVWVTRDLALAGTRGGR